MFRSRRAWAAAAVSIAAIAYPLYRTATARKRQSGSLVDRSAPSPIPARTLPVSSFSSTPLIATAQCEGAESEYDEADIDRERLCLFAGSSNIELSKEIAAILGVQLGSVKINRFTDGEVGIQVEDNVRGKDVYIVQSTGPPINDNIVELLLLVSCMRRASAKTICVCIPYYGYSRQDRKREARDTIAAADIARLLEACGVDRVISVDLHSGQIQGFFSKLTPVENLSCTHELMAPHFVKRNLYRPVVVSTSGTGIQRVNRFRDELRLQGIDAGIAFVAPMDNHGVLVAINELHHHRVHEQETLVVVGDVRDSDCIIVDDMVDTGTRLKLAALKIKEQGGNRVFACATHGVLSNKDLESQLDASPIQELVLTNTLARPAHITSKKIRYLSVAPLLADAIFRLHTALPLSQLTSQYEYGQ